MVMRTCLTTGETRLDPPRNRRKLGRSRLIGRKLLVTPHDCSEVNSRDYDSDDDRSDRFLGSSWSKTRSARWRRCRYLHDVYPC
jgi:hypothetical protein